MDGRPQQDEYEMPIRDTEKTLAGHKTHWGRRDDGIPVHSSELTRTNKQGRAFTCGDCGRRLRACVSRGKPGTRFVSSYFSHRRDEGDCCGGRDEGVRGESDLHLRAKEILAEQAEFMYPPLPIEAMSADGSVRLTGNAVEPGRFGFTRVLAEREAAAYVRRMKPEDDSQYIPDLVLIDDASNRFVLVEIWVTHPVGNEKQLWLEHLELPCVQVFLGSRWLGEGSFDSEGLEEEIVRGQDPEKKSWLWHPSAAAALRGLEADAEQEAERARATRKQEEEEDARARQEAACREIDRMTYKERKQREQGERLAESLRTQDARAAETWKDPAWLPYAADFGLPEGVLPDIVDVPLEGEERFSVRRAVWQAQVLTSWCLNKERDTGRSLSVPAEKVAEVLEKYSPAFLVPTASVPREVPPLARVMESYLWELRHEGLLKPPFLKGGPFTYVRGSLPRLLKRIAAEATAEGARQPIP